MRPRRVHIVESNVQFVSMFEKRGWVVEPDLSKADLVQFTGGADVSPYLYGETKHPSTYSTKDRDLREQAIFETCRRLGKPMAGICRGGQFLNVMCGGKMYQNVNNHALHGTHMIVNLETGGLIAGTSTHHQMMREGPGAVILGVASESTLYEYMEDGRIGYHIPERGQDIEVLWYPKYQALCFQPHPEYMDGSSVCQGWYFKLIDLKLMEGEKPCVDLQA